MNCCNDFGTCESGLGCPCRRDEVKPAAVARIKASSAHEVGNIWFTEPEPTEPLTRFELVAVRGTVLVFGLTNAVLVVMGAGYVWQRWLA